jgi:hypothetical protein
LPWSSASGKVAAVTLEAAGSGLQGELVATKGKGKRPNVVQVAQIADMLKTTRQNADNLSKRKGFPEPADEWPSGKIWWLSEVLAWARREGRHVDGA